MEKADIVIIGSGIAGLSLALNLAEKKSNISIVIITKSGKDEGSTRLAQGGIACVLEYENDSFEAHIHDTLKAGGGRSNPYITRKVVENAPFCLEKMQNWGVDFTKNKDNKLELALEGGHSFKRIVHAKDATGKEIERALLEKASKIESIKLLTYLDLEDILLDNNICVGVRLNDNSNQKQYDFYCNSVVLATGGCGQLFQYTTNPIISTGDGLAIAFKHGVKISHLNYIQFHPTAFYEENKSPLFLISEAVRGAGAFIVNAKEERFVFKDDVRGELATRDIVTKSILNELEKSNEKCVYLDCRHFDLEKYKSDFPTIYQYLNEKGISIKVDLIPIIPAAHYQCGGITVNEFGESSLSNLYAIGECADTGLHGKNRLASNSLLEAVAFAEFCSEDILKKLKTNGESRIIESELKNNNDFNSVVSFEMRKIMSNHAIIGSSLSQIETGLLKLNELKRKQSTVFVDAKLNRQFIVSELILKEMKNEFISREKSIENIF